MRYSFDVSFSAEAQAHMILRRLQKQGVSPDEIFRRLFWDLYAYPPAALSALQELYPRYYPDDSPQYGLVVLDNRRLLRADFT